MTAKERQSAGRAGPPIPRHCAPESGFHSAIYCITGDNSTRTHPAATAHCTVAAMSSRGRLVFRKVRVAHTRHGAQPLLKNGERDLNVGATIDQRQTSLHLSETFFFFLIFEFASAFFTSIVVNRQVVFFYFFFCFVNGDFFSIQMCF